MSFKYHIYSLYISCAHPLFLFFLHYCVNKLVSSILPVQDLTFFGAIFGNHAFYKIDKNLSEGNALIRCFIIFIVYMHTSTFFKLSPLSAPPAASPDGPPHTGDLHAQLCLDPVSHEPVIHHRCASRLNYEGEILLHVPVRPAGHLC